MVDFDICIFLFAGIQRIRIQLITCLMYTITVLCGSPLFFRTCNEIWERQAAALSATENDDLDYGRWLILMSKAANVFLRGFCVECINSNHRLGFHVIQAVGGRGGQKSSQKLPTETYIVLYIYMI